MTYNSLEANMRRAEQDRISDQRRFEWKQLENQTTSEVEKFNAEQTVVLDTFAKDHGWTKQHMYRFAVRIFSDQFCRYYLQNSTAFDSPDIRA